MRLSGWFDPIPIHVTRKNADGMIGTVHVGAWMLVPIMLLAAANLIAWGFIGLYVAAKVAF